MIRLSPAAEGDLRAIADWIRDRGGARTSLRVHDRILAALRPLGRFPLMAQAGRVPGTRELVIGGLPYVAIYKLDADGVVVLRILHGAQLRPPC